MSFLRSEGLTYSMTVVWKKMSKLVICSKKWFSWYPPFTTFMNRLSRGRWLTRAMVRTSGNDLILLDLHVYAINLILTLVPVLFLWIWMGKLAPKEIKLIHLLQRRYGTLKNKEDLSSPAPSRRFQGTGFIRNGRSCHFIISENSAVHKEAPSVNPSALSHVSY